MYRAKITVVGSINMDMVTQCRRFPDIGETLMGTDFQRYSGGKGANQAVAAARLGADVTMVGAVGDDGFGYELLTVLNREGVNTDYVKTLPDLPSGMANITVADGENQIIVVPGANSGLTPADVEAAESRIAEADVVLAQLEIPMDCVITAAKLAAKHGKPFVLNPAPAQRLPEELLELVTLLTPNTTELACSLGLPAGMSAEEMIRRSRCPVLMTIGSDGALYNDENGQIHHQPAFRAIPVDSTGAGDTFNGAFAVYWKDGMASAVKKACAAAALSIAKAGAQSGMPFEEELEAFLAQQAV
ncbi:ribokinase [Neisseria sp.]|uniref:ribokinase n=1 Tax=Neisseria sp. TaxID=192066 RepID=UPI0035A0D873